MSGGGPQALGFVLLCHTALHRAEALARHWARQGCPVVLHVDAAVPEAQVAALRAGLADLPDIRFAPRHRCEWGTFALVRAMQDAAGLLLAAFPRLRHVYAASGACLPLRPVAELCAYLDARPETDFIESVTTEDVPWTVGGLSQERFTLSFPFSWRRQRWLFDRWVTLQRRLGRRRRMPAGLVPHLGSQWWCLTRRTLEAILTDPDRPALDRYFARVWIPDESYFQTLARRWSRDIEARSLTLSKFDFQGKPHVFYDDHLPLLRRSDCFVARKIWPEAEGLYRHFLRPDPGARTMAEPNPGRIDRIFARANERRTRGRPGLYMQSRYPHWGWENGRTAAPYSVFEGFAELFEDFAGWLSKRSGLRVHGHLYAPGRAELAGGAAVFNGALCDSAALRDHAPESFLTSLIWNTRGERQCFQFGPADTQDIAGLIAGDQNAEVAVITGAWALGLWRSGAPVEVLRPEAARLQQVETAHLKLLRAPWAKARLRVWSLADAAAAPQEVLAAALEGLGQGRPQAPPRMVDLDGFGGFLQALRNLGMQPTLTGDFPAPPPPALAHAAAGPSGAAVSGPPASARAAPGGAPSGGPPCHGSPTDRAPSDGAPRSAASGARR